jgi:hypothetical protein
MQSFNPLKWKLGGFLRQAQATTPTTTALK